MAENLPYYESLLAFDKDPIGTRRSAITYDHDRLDMTKKQKPRLRFNDEWEEETKKREKKEKEANKDIELTKSISVNEKKTKPVQKMIKFKKRFERGERP